MLCSRTRSSSLFASMTRRCLVLSSLAGVLTERYLRFGDDEVVVWGADQADRTAEQRRDTGEQGDRGGVLVLHGVPRRQRNRHPGEPEGRGGVCGSRTDPRRHKLAFCRGDERLVLEGDRLPRQ
eukprot:289102-Rhodomonas_salina.1